MSAANAIALVPTAGLNFKAYEQEQPNYPTLNQPQGGTFNQETQQKEVLKGNPVFNTPGLTSGG